ncbi:serine/threonine-protein kinase [Streptomyces sp. NPDC090077]|uniref:serine/threonine-protein kinase n=1 Tax=Streptomyces sp. NPDC090077 TaxID=3365938 RepID=UPI00381DD4BF
MSGQRSLADGRYVLEPEPIGAGGMGTVWRGYDRRLHRTVAVKALHLPAGFDAEEQSRLRVRAVREARAIARLEHPGIVAVHDVLEEDGQPWIVMRFVDGRSLDQEVRANGPLGPQRAAEIGGQLVNALSAAHDAGVLHLDVKPQNVLLDDKGRAVLTDFGIASVADATAPRTKALVGTLGYIAPERLAGTEPGPAADMWSLGATLYFAVEGRPAYPADNVGAAVAAVMTRDPEPMARAGVLAPTITGLLERDPEQRTDAVRAATELRAAAGTMTLDRQDLPRRPVLKHKTVVALVAPLLLAVGAVLPYVVSQARGDAGRRPTTESSPATSSPALATSAGPSPAPSASPTPTPSPTPTARYQSIPRICDKVGRRSSSIIPDMDAGKEENWVPNPGRFGGLIEAYACRWSTDGYWADHPWGADVSVTLLRFSSGAYGATAFEGERTDSFYKSVPRLHDFADELCVSNPTGKDYGYAHVIFRVDNMLVQVSYEMMVEVPSAPAPAPAVAKPRGMEMAKYVHDELTAGS